MVRDHAPLFVPQLFDVPVDAGSRRGRAPTPETN